MSKMGLYLYSLSIADTNQMFQQGLLPNQGLGKENKKKINLIVPEGTPPRAGLGYF